MIFEVIQIEFDFDLDSNEEPVSPEYKQKLNEMVRDCDWYVEHEEDLVDEISDSVGWCIKSIEYCEVKTALTSRNDPNRYNHF